jgi:serine/threonine protein kinase
MDAALRQATPFGKYVLLERVSVGGMAEVFKAKAFGVEGFEKILAIKRILPSMAEDADFIEMFIDEAKICGQLNHANICQIYELGRVSDAHFIAMEYVWGKDVLQMQNRFRKLRQKMKPEMAAYIACKICEGLDYAHKKKDANGKPLGIIHRDISPQNILVSYEGELKVIDFGIAKAASRSSKTQAGVLKGKFGYMSPEQVRGLPLDRRSDIFAIGTILYELLTTERLFYGESDFETLEKVRNVDVPPPSQVSPGCPKALEKIILRALAKDVEGRYQWASEMAEELNAFLLSHDPVFSAQNLATWMRDQFAVEMRRERLILDEQQKVTREALQASAPLMSMKQPTLAPSARPGQKSAAKLPAVAPTAAMNVGKSVSKDVDISDLDELQDEDDDFNEKTTVSAPGGFGVPVEAAADASALPEQSTRILDSATPGPPPRPGSASAGDLPAQSTVLFDNSGSTSMPPLAGQPFTGPVDPSVYSRPPDPFTPHYGQLVPPPASLPRPPKSTVWKDILIGVAVAAAVVGGVLGARAYMAKRGQAMLVVLSPTAGGALFLDGTAKGALASGTPLALKGLSVGEHQVVVKGDAGEFRQAVTLAAGEPNFITVSFSSTGVESGRLRLEIEAPGANGAYAPARADVYVDGAQLSAEAGSEPISLRSGTTHEVRVQKSGMAEQRFTVDIKPNETVVRQVHLVAAGGKILITSEPAGAEVSINGHRLGLTPVTANDLDPAHSARVSLRLSGFQSVTKNISFERGLDQTLEVRLIAGKEGKEGEGEVVAKSEPKPEAKSEPKPEAKSEPKPDKVEKTDKPDKSGTKVAAAKTKSEPKETPAEKPKDEPKTGGKQMPSDGLAPINFGADKGGSASEPGFLVANTQPWAKVLIDGKDTGKTTPIAPRSKIPLKPGKHTVTFVVSGKKYNFDISVKPGEEVRLIKQLSDSP